MAERITVVARIKAKPGKEEETKKGLQALLAPTRAETGCINYDLHQSQDDPARFLLYENWESKEALDRHLQSSHLQAFLQRADERMAQPAEIRFYRMIR